MTEQRADLVLRGLRNSSFGIAYASPPSGNSPTLPPFSRPHIIRFSIYLFIACYLVTQGLGYLGWKSTTRSVELVLTLCVYLVTGLPFFVWISDCFRAGKILPDRFLQFSPRMRVWYVCSTSYVLALLVLALFPETARGVSSGVRLLVTAGFAFALHQLIVTRRRGAAPDVRRPSSAFGLYVGTSTGILGGLSHGAAIQAGRNVTLDLHDAAQNILILGGIGSGKTTRAVQPLLTQLLDQDSGGLIFDIKGDFIQAAETLARLSGRELTVIGPGRTRMNLLSGLSPEVAASFLKSALLGNARSVTDAFWIDTATELCKNSLGVLSFFPGRYSLVELHTYLFDPAIRSGINAEAQVKILSLPDRESRLLKAYLSYHETVFAAFDDKVKSGVNASVSQILSPFNHPDLVDAFCTEDPTAPRMEHVLDGTVYLVDMPLSKWGLGGKVAYQFIKLRFFNVMQRRNSEPSWNRERPVFFMCDEYQEIVSANRDGLSDLNFWDKSRSSKCIGIISAQAVSSFYAAIGQRDLADALLQNFRQKLCFRTEDSHTIEMLNHLLGRVEVERVSLQEGRGEQFSGLATSSSSSSLSTSRSTIEKQILNPQLFRTLGQNEALALLSFGGLSADDVIQCVPVFV